MFRYVQCDLNHILGPSLNGIKITVGRLTSSAPRRSHYGGHQPTWRAGDTRPDPREDDGSIAIRRRQRPQRCRSWWARSGMRCRCRVSRSPALPAAGASSAPSDTGNAGMERVSGASAGRPSLPRGYPRRCRAPQRAKRARTGAGPASRGAPKRSERASRAKPDGRTATREGQGVRGIGVYPPGRAACIHR